MYTLGTKQVGSCPYCTHGKLDYVVIIGFPADTNEGHLKIIECEWSCFNYMLTGFNKSFIFKNYIHIVSLLLQRLWELETTRLLEVFREMLEADLEDDDLYFVEKGYNLPVSNVTPEEFHNRLRFPLVEVLKYPYLLCHQELCKLLMKV